MEEDPHQVLEGIILACYATRASTAYIYLRYEYGRSFRVLQRAIDEAYAANLLGKNILGKDFNLDVYLHRGAGAYICGEETGLIESLEGKRAWPRIKPPFPAVEGAFRKPTVVNNIETLACVTHIVERGADWFKSIGVPPDPKNPRDAGSYGPKLYCISGHVNKPAASNCRWDHRARAGRRVRRRRLEGAQGQGLHSRRHQHGPPDGEGVRHAARLQRPGQGRLPRAGHGRRDRLRRTDEHRRRALQLCRFFAHESCGQCTPCREGTGWMMKITDRIRRGHGRLEDLNVLLDVGEPIGIMPGTTICGLADGAAWPVKNAVTKFRAEFEELIRTGRRVTRPLVGSAH